jgi:hypothetical protein
MNWADKVDKAVELLSEVMEGMTKEELEEYGFPYVNPAYEQLMNARLKSESEKGAEPPMNENFPAKARVTFTDDIVTISILVNYKPEERGKIVEDAKWELSFTYDIDVSHVSNYRVVCVETEQPDGTRVRIPVDK